MGKALPSGPSGLPTHEIAYNSTAMRGSLPKTITVRSFAKINIGLYIGAARADGFHDLRTVYQTIALHDVIRVNVGRGSGIEILCKNNDPRVPLDSSNTCYRMAQLVMQELNAPGRVSIAIDKRLPVQGGLGAASSNAVATLLGLEQAFRQKLPDLTRLGLAAEVGSDLPQFLVGGASLGVGRGEEVYPLADFPAVPVVLVMPEVGVSTARAFADWDALLQSGAESSAARQSNLSAAKQARWTQAALTRAGASDRMFLTGGALAAWLFKFSSGYPNTGASAKGGSRAGNLLSDLVRTGIENDFEKVVFRSISRIA